MRLRRMTCPECGRTVAVNEVAGTVRKHVRKTGMLANCPGSDRPAPLPEEDGP